MDENETTQAPTPLERVKTFLGKHKIAIAAITVGAVAYVVATRVKDGEPVIELDNILPTE